MRMINRSTGRGLRPVQKYFMNMANNDDDDGNDDDMELDDDSINEDADKSLMEVSDHADDDSDDDENLSQEQKNKLKYFKIAFIEEVNEVTRPDKVVLLGEKARLYVENGFMNSFATRGRFGFNKNESKSAYGNPDEPTTPAKKPRLGPSSSSYSYNQNQKYGGSMPKARTVSEYLLVALAIRNHTKTRENPRREANQATSQEITTFLNNYFKRDGVPTSTAVCFVRANVLTRNLITFQRPIGSLGLNMTINRRISGCLASTHWMMAKKRLNKLLKLTRKMEIWQKCS